MRLSAPSWLYPSRLNSDTSRAVGTCPKMKLFNSDRTSETRGERERRGKGQRAGRDGWRVSGELWRIWAISTGASFGAFNLGRFTGVCGGFWTIVDKSHERRENRLVCANKRLKIGAAVRACLGKADYPTISTVKAKKNRQRARTPRRLCL